MRGFGGCFNELGWIALAALPRERRDAVLDALFDPRRGCRFTFARLPIGASDYAAGWYSHNETDGDFAMRRFSIARDRLHLIPYIREALRRQPDLTLFASPWSPPTWLKRPPVYNYGTLVWEPRFLRAYALYFVRFVEAYRRESIRIRQVHVQNEPVADQKFPSCLWTGAQLRDFIRDYLGPAFRRRRLDCEIWLGTLNTGDYDGYPNTVLSDPGARRCVAGVGFQWAGKEAIQRTHQSWPAVPLMQTENECGDGRNTWAYATYVFNLLQHYITNGAGAYFYWNMVLEQGGRSTWGWPQNSMVTVDPATRRATFTPEFYVMKHVAHHVPPRSVRLGLAGDLAGNTLAFETPQRDRVLVTSNPFDTVRPLTIASERGRVTADLPPRSFNTLLLP
jgi:glucosylceramidase